LSQFTIGTRTDFSNNIEEILKEKAANFQWFSEAMDESTDVSDTAQLALFVRGIDNEFNVTEELACLMAMKGTTTSEDLNDKIKKVLQKLNVRILKLVGVVTDGAPSITGKNTGLSSLITKDMKNITGRYLFVYHCLVHQGNLCAISVKMTNVITVVAKLVNYVRSKGLNHRQFQQFLSDMDSENGDVLYYTEVRWLN
jgi:galactitol-specific phosphotransferase system IIB component